MNEEAALALPGLFINGWHLRAESNQDGVTIRMIALDNQTPRVCLIQGLASIERLTTELSMMICQIKAAAGSLQ